MLSVLDDAAVATVGVELTSVTVDGANVTFRYELPGGDPVEGGFFEHRTP